MPVTIEDASHRSATAASLLKPTTASKVQDIVQKAFNHESLLTTVGGKTGLTGGCTPVYGGDAIDMSEFLSVPPRPGYRAIPAMFGGKPGNYLLSEATPKTGIFPPGVTLAEMDKALAEQSLFFASKPAYLGGQIGGATATNASGPRTYAFGNTRDNVVGLEVVLPNGELVKLRRSNSRPGKTFSLPGIEGTIPFPAYPPSKVKNSAGFYSSPDMSPIDLFVGCEGTLGIFTEIEVKLLDRRPIDTQLFLFPSIEQAFGFADAVREKADVISLEFMDQNALSMVADLFEEKNIDIKKIAAGIEIEYFKDNSLVTAQVSDYRSQYDAVKEQLEGAFVTTVRQQIPQRVNALMADRGHVKIASDFAVPADKFPEMYAAHRAADVEMARATGEKVGSATWGHLGNYNLHWNALPNSEASKTTAHQLYKSLARKALDLGGTLSAEHATGKKQVFPGEPMLFSINTSMFAYAEQLIYTVNPDFRLNRGNIIGYPSKHGQE